MVWRSLASALAALLLLSPGAAAQGVPGQSGWTAWMDMNQSTCVDRARNAIASQGLDVRHVDTWYVHGYGGGRFISITCAADDGSKNLVSASAGRQLVQVLVVRQSGSGDTGNLRDALSAYMRGGQGTTPAEVAADWARTAQEYRGRIGMRITYACPAGGSKGRGPWGTDIYTDDSSVCTAAVHAGLITFARGGRVTIEIVPGQSSYTGSTRNGVTTYGYGAWGGAFAFVR